MKKLIIVLILAAAAVSCSRKPEAVNKSKAKGQLEVVSVNGYTEIS